MAVLLSNAPEQGQLVSVRQRRFVVTEVVKSGLLESPLQVGASPAQHLITLSSVEDDALGEELQVIWELEPGAEVIEKVALPEPTGFDPPDRLDAFLDAVRWGAASTADRRSISRPSHQRWRESRNHPLPKAGYPSIRYILLHSFAHAVIRQLAVECGYTAASIRERIYSRPADEGSPMAGVLLYTAAPDSEGTLGGPSASAENAIQ